MKTKNLFMIICILFCPPYFSHSLTFAQTSNDSLQAERIRISRDQISLDVGGLLTHSLSYARRIGDTKLSLGGRLGFAWELNSNSLERSILDALHVTVFGRYQLLHALQVDIGPTLIRYVWTDDCSECAGTFVGLHSIAAVGYRFVFFGPYLQAGWADDSAYGSEFGAIWGLQARLMLAWGK